MNNSLEKEIRLLDINSITTYFFIFSLFISNVLNRDEKADRLNQPRIFSNNQAQKIAVANRILVIILGLIFLYINYTNVGIAKSKGRPTKYLSLQVLASLINLISAFIILYVVVSNLGNQDFNVSGTENPEI